MKIHDYKTVYGDTPFELDHYVQKCIKEGYQPFGSPYYIGSPAGNVAVQICQAVVKYTSVSHAPAVAQAG